MNAFPFFPVVFIRNVIGLSPNVLPNDAKIQKKNHN